MRMRITYLISVIVLCWSSAASAQGIDPRVAHLASRILNRVPDIPHTALALGRGNERPRRALEHASAIVAAADAHNSTWEEFRRRGDWQYFEPRQDLPALIAAITFRESAFQSVIRLDNGTRMYASGTINVRTLTQLPMADRGVMQVRAPSGPAQRCGVRTRDDLARLNTDLRFSYHVGTCVLTNRLDRYIDQYTRSNFKRLQNGQRPSMDLRFYGLWGPRRNTEDALRARELLVLERYNWGGRDLYLSPSAAGYARRVLTEFEFFRSSGGNGGEGTDG